MAGGSRKEGASLKNARLRHECYRFHCKPPLTECFKRRRKIEFERTYYQSVQALQRDILRIFTDCRHSDFYIIHGCSVVETNDCIVRTRSPKLYKTLEAYFVHSSNNIIKCYIETPEIFQRIKDFSRLLYSNLDVEQEEDILVRLYLQSLKGNFELSESPRADYTFYPRERRCKDISNFHPLDDKRAKKEDGADDLSTSDMADSGLETGSLSPLENSENSDLEESNGGTSLSESRDKKSAVVSSYGSSESADGKKSCTAESDSAGCSSLEQPVTCNEYNGSSDSRETRKQDIIGALRNENCIVSTDPTSPTTSRRRDNSLNTKELCRNDEAPIGGRSSDPLNKKSSSSVSSYYFIDASSLNDEEEIASLIMANSRGNMSIYAGNYVPTRRSSNQEEHTARKIGHERVAEFQRELKISECLMPRRVKRVVEEKSGIEKEALVVEIKEADSGESTSPDESSKDSKITDKSSNPPPLIRRNTFELDPNDEKLSVLRQEYERRQGHLLFQSSIPQYSGHRVDGDSCFEPPSDESSSAPVIAQVLTKFSVNLNTVKYSKTGDQLGANNIADSNETNLSEVLTETRSPEEMTSSWGSGTRRVPANDHSLPMKLFTDPSRSDEGSRNCCTSLPISLNNYQLPRDGPAKRAKETTPPIISPGGDGSSGVVEKKIESTVPSVGIVKPAMASSMTAAWVVDMSDCGKNAGSTSQMSKSFSSSSDCVNRKNGKKPCETKHNSLGFFVNLNDIDGTKREEVKKVESVKHSCEFFVDISGDNGREIEGRNEKVGNLGESSDKKNIFSMFIDLKESPSGPDKPPSRLFEKRAEAKLPSGDSGESSSSSLIDQSGQNSCGSSAERGKPSVFMFIESDSPVVRRRALSSSRPAFQRHSWNVDKTQGAKDVRHKRAHSVSVDRADLRKLQTNSSNSSHSLSQVARADTLNILPTKRVNEQESSRNTSTEEVFEYDVRDTPPNSHVEIALDEDTRIKSNNYNGGKEISSARIYEEVSVWERTESTNGRKSETFDISSASEPSPPESDNYHLDDLRNGENEVSQDDGDVVNKVSETHKSLTETIKKIESELKKPEYGDYEASYVSRKDTKSRKAFVRLSDLDKTPSGSRASELPEDRTIYRTSIPETSWVESKLAAVANAPVRPLPRKFPTIMSTSLPAKQKSPIEDAEAVISESDLSSMQSSMGRSGADVSTEETETWSMGVTKPYNRLGEDLLRMFLEEINPDVTIDVAGRRIRAHKCILSSRCQYFAAILSGGWIESAGNVIALQGYSYNAVHFALCHIYSGESNIPETLSIVELATLADMLCLEGLKEVIGYTLKVKYCHLFHKPCQVCAVGVLECMPLAAAYGLDEVYRKSLRWITRHFVRIWPCKAFATLPRELMDKCYHQHIVHMSTDNVLETMMDCDKLLATLPNVRWAEPVFRMVSNLLETAVKYISDNFSGVLGNDNFQALGRDLTWNISRLEDNFLAAADRLPPDQACKSYSKLNKMLAATPQPPWSPLFIDFLRKIQSRVEKCLVKEASRAARTTTWLKMDLELRRRIQELACLVILPHEALKRPSRHSNFLKEPRVPSSRIASRSLDLRRVKMAISEHNDKTTKQATTTTSAPGTTQQVKKPMLVKPKSDPLERKIPQEEKQVVSDSVALRPKSWPNKLEVKSRYLEPRNKPVMIKERVIVQQRRKIMISSSDSSRTSSPAMKRAIDKKPLAKMKLTIKKDVGKALSSDSLAEATRSTTKKDAAAAAATSKSCGITRPESPSLKQKDIGLSADSLAEPRKTKQITKKKPGKVMDTSMSTDSLMAETTPKSSNVSNKVSPTMGRVPKTQIYDRVKKSSPPVQQKSPLTTGRKLPRSLECSTAASRNRAAAISAYHGNLRRNLLDAAKTPDVPAKTVNVPSPRQQSLPSTVTSSSKKDKRETSQPSTESPRCSPKSNGRTNRVITPAKRPVKATENRAKCHNGDATKQPTVGSRSGTFLKDEPTILKKSDIKTAQIGTS